jgi:ABC-type glycerol-3-phosphate transport system permease component
VTAIKSPSGLTGTQPRDSAPAASPRSRGRRLARRSPVAFTVAALVAIIMVLPFVTLIISALTPADQLGIDRWLPSYLRWSNFADAVRYIPFGSMAKSSLILSSIFGILTTLSSALTGYGFARLRGPGKNVLFALLIGTMMVPPIVTLIPTYLLFSDYHLVGTYWPWVLWGATGTPYAIFLYRQYFSGFPKELEEAAVIDGAGQLRIFFQIFLPLSRPLLVTAFVLAFNAAWGDYIGPNLFLNQSNTTLAVGVATGYENSQGYTLYNLLAGGALIYVVPVILLFLFAQRSYVRGFATSGMK